MASQGLTLTFSHLPSTASKRQEKKNFPGTTFSLPKLFNICTMTPKPNNRLIPFYKIMQSAKVTSVGVFKIIAFI